jgi:hypothetical protein
MIHYLDYLETCFRFDSAQAPALVPPRAAALLSSLWLQRTMGLCACIVELVAFYLKVVIIVVVGMTKQDVERAGDNAELTNNPIDTAEISDNVLHTSPAAILQPSVAVPIEGSIASSASTNDLHQYPPAPSSSSSTPMVAHLDDASPVQAESVSADNTF